MKKIFFGFSLLTLLCLHATAQKEIVWGDPHVAESLKAISQEPEFKTFRAKVDALIASAKGKNTNAAAVKNLFAANKTMLRTLYTKHGLSNRMSQVQNASGNNVIKAVSERPYMLNQQAIQSGMQKVITSYDKVYYDSDNWDGAPGNRFPRMSATLDSISYPKTLAITSKPCTSNNNNNSNYNNCIWGGNIYGYKQKIKVPNNPKILSASIRFEYEIDYSGWDGNLAINEIELDIQASNNFNSTTYKDLPIGLHLLTSDLKKIKTLYARDTVTADFKEIHIKNSGSYTMEGYVVPGSEIDLTFGFVYANKTYKGWFGSYHYGEIKLNRIIVTYKE